MSKCSKCGKRCSKYSAECKACYRARMEGLHAEARAHVKANACPCCGAGLRRNLALTGWWQCAQYGFRADASKPACSFQCFTEQWEKKR